jgi:hypothetical protein
MLLRGDEVPSPDDLSAMLKTFIRHPLHTSLARAYMRGARKWVRAVGRRKALLNINSTARPGWRLAPAPWPRPPFPP